MKKALLWLLQSVVLLFSVSSCDQSPTTGAKQSVEQRMANARAAKAEKKSGPVAIDAGMARPEKATEADYKAPVDKVLKGPNGEVVHTGERGAKFYINKYGNKTYLSSNQ